MTIKFRPSTSWGTVRTNLITDKSVPGEERSHENSMSVWTQNCMLYLCSFYSCVIHIFVFYLAPYGMWSEFSFQNALLIWWVRNGLQGGDGSVTRQRVNQHRAVDSSRQKWCLRTRTWSLLSSWAFFCKLRELHFPRYTFFFKLMALKPLRTIKLANQQSWAHGSCSANDDGIEMDH